MLTIHHLGIGQGERVLWLCEELGIEYNLVRHTRAPLLAPESLEKLPGQRTGKSPFLDDPEHDVHLNESAACLEYIINQYGNGRFALKVGDPNYAEYLYWFHYANGTFQPAMIDAQFFAIAGLGDDNQMKQFALQRLRVAFELVDRRLGESKFLAGPELTAADMMLLYSVTTQRYWGAQMDLTPFKNIQRWISDCSSRPAYQRAMEKGDPEMEPMLNTKPPSIGMFQAGGVTESYHWKKKTQQNL